MNKPGKVFRSRKGGHLAVRMDIPLEPHKQSKLKDILDEEWKKVEPILLARISAEIVGKEMVGKEIGVSNV